MFLLDKVSIPSLIDRKEKKKKKKLALGELDLHSEVNPTWAKLTRVEWTLGIGVLDLEDKEFQWQIML